MRRKRKVPGLNNSSIADISFILPSFFLMTTSMGADKGLQRRLPPQTDEKEKKAETDIKERNLLKIEVDASGNILCNGKPMKKEALTAEVKTFVSNKDNSPSLPEKHKVDIPLLGENISATTEHLIALQTNPRTSYEIYFDIQDRIIRGYTELRNELSLRKFGQPFASLNNEQKEAVRQFYPQRISEIEITQKGGEE